MYINYLLIIFKQALELYRVSNTVLNFLHKSFDSEEARQALNILAQNNPEFYVEIASGQSKNSVSDADKKVAEEEDNGWNLGEGDNVSLTLNIIITCTVASEQNSRMPDNIDSDCNFFKDDQQLSAKVQQSVHTQGEQEKHDQAEESK